MSASALAGERRALASRRGSLLRRRPTQAHETGESAAGGCPLVGEADGERGVTLATRLGGERALPIDRGLVLLSHERLCRHVLVCGATEPPRVSWRRFCLSSDYIK
jgi:hypothetical protein